MHHCPPQKTPIHSIIPPPKQGLKYEKNPATKATITQRVDGYMKRAEDLKVCGVMIRRRGRHRVHVVLFIFVLCHLE
jgi:hypothetical protein